MGCGATVDGGGHLTSDEWFVLRNPVVEEEVKVTSFVFEETGVDFYSCVAKDADAFASNIGIGVFGADVDFADSGIKDG